MATKLIKKIMTKIETKLVTEIVTKMVTEMMTDTPKQASTIVKEGQDDADDRSSFKKKVVKMTFHARNIQCVVSIAILPTPTLIKPMKCTR